MQKRRTMSIFVALAALASVVFAMTPSHAATACTPLSGFHSDGVGEPLDPTDSGSAAAPYLDITSWKFCATSGTGQGGGVLQATVNVNAAWPKNEELPREVGDTGYTVNLFYASGGTGPSNLLPENDATALMHRRQRTGLLQEGERYAYQGPFPIGDRWQWSIEMEWRYSPNPQGADWGPVFAFTRWDPSRSLTFTELLAADNPGLSGSLSTDGKTITIQVPYQIKWRAAKTKGQGTQVGGTTYHQHSMYITQSGHKVANAWAVTWANATTSLPPAVCAVTQPAAGLCGIGGVIAQNDQAPDNSGLLGEYGFVSYVPTEKCPQYVSTPIAAGPQTGGEYYRQVNPVANNPDWKPCYTHLPLSRSFFSSGLGFIAP